MLVLGRKENESILIGENIRITIVGRSGSSIRIGVEAPREVKIVRTELTQQPSTHQLAVDVSAVDKAENRDERREAAEQQSSDVTGSGANHSGPNHSGQAVPLPPTLPFGSRAAG